MTPLRWARTAVAAYLIPVVAGCVSVVSRAPHDSAHDATPADKASPRPELVQPSFDEASAHGRSVGLPPATGKARLRA